MKRIIFVMINQALQVLDLSAEGTHQPSIDFWLEYKIGPKRRECAPCFSDEMITNIIIRVDTNRMSYISYGRL